MVRSDKRPPAHTSTPAAEGQAEDSPGILHLDMDAFFASIEIRDDPALQGRPVVVGGTSDRAVVAAASYPARAFGIRSAMPMAAARRLTRDLVIVPPRIDHYRRVSRQVMAILRDVVATVEQISVDEAFLDVRPARRLFGPPETIADLLRSRIRSELGLPSSVGGSVSRPVAKIASGAAKPDGVLIIPAEKTAQFLAPLPVSVIAGVGPRAVERLQRLGVRTVSDLRAVPSSTLARILGPRAVDVARLAAGEDRTGLGAHSRDRSLGTERTWDQDLADPSEVRRRITAMSDDVARQLRQHGFVTRTVVLKLRAPDGTTITRSSTLGQPSASGERLREHVVALWEREAATMPRVRLAGVRASHLERAEQHGAQELAGRTTGWQGLESAWDRAAERFGRASITRGSALEARSTAREVDPTTREADRD
ncbi:DNA polymerase IV [Brachybacterium timonense]|uniref:DNA polymerase IV n=1 Tax=Brachybacterium timonense TaxID=2050896 RepID=UPI000D0AE57C|nr:DNA polymerase IV [Brachybacterium timonense]